MKKLIFIVLITTGLFAWGGNDIQKQAKDEIQVVCVKGYLFVITTVHNGSGTGVAITQIMAEHNGSSHPIKCNKGR